MPKVLLGTPSGELLSAYTVQCFSALIAANHPLPWSLMVGTYVELNQNLIVREALKRDFTHILFIDCDMVFPTTILTRLLSHNHNIVGATYRTRGGDHHFTSVNLDGQFSTTADFGVREVISVPSGMMLVKRKVFETLSYPWFFNTYGEQFSDIVGNDVNFCRKAKDAGFSIYCDFFASRDIKHIGTETFGWNLGA